MAPIRTASKTSGVENINGLSQGITTRSKQLASLKSYKDSMKVPNKRKADSPLKDMTAKRAAFGDITNAFNKSSANHDKDKAMPMKKVTVESKMLPTLKSVKPQTTAVNGKASKTKQLQKAATNAIESVQKHFAKDPPKVISTRSQNGILKNIERKSFGKENQNQSQSSTKSGRSDVSGEPSLYVTALENMRYPKGGTMIRKPGSDDGIPEKSRGSLENRSDDYTPSETTKDGYKMISEKLDKVNLDDTVNRSLDEETDDPHEVPEGVADFDKENWNDITQVSNYAMDIFNYLKSRERLYVIDDYLARMKGITTWMRALLVDWMVEVQESFELNHETLYLAVKLVDLYLTRSSKTLPEKEHLSKDDLQLLGASSMFIASKFDERIPPLVDDFLYICDGAYPLPKLLAMEMKILQVIDFNLGIPLSYRFLRRYARCARVSMPTLTLARFVLEQCLLEYALAARSDSLLAAAALYLALRMKALGGWTTTLHYYTGYTLKEILPLAIEINGVLHKKPKSAISTVRNKYSHTVFFEVAKVPLIDDAALSS